jgi:hypothetical protein
MKKTRIIGALLIGLAAPLAATAQQTDRNQMRSYVQEQVMPTLKEARLELDAKLSAADKAKIDQLRQEQKALREEGKSQRPLHQKMRENPESLSDAEKLSLFNHKLAQKELRKQAAEIAKSNEAALRDVLEPLKPQAEQWREDLKELKPEMERANGKSEGHYKGRGHQGRFGKMLKPASFILFDPTAPARAHKGGKGGAKANLIYPNPATNMATLSYSTAAAGDVVIIARGRNGEGQKELFSGYQPAGEHELQFSTEGLTGDMALIVVKSAAGREVTRLVLQ